MATFKDCTAFNNGRHGFVGSTSDSFEGCSAFDNGRDGFHIRPSREMLAEIKTEIEAGASGKALHERFGAALEEIARPTAAIVAFGANSVELWNWYNALSAGSGA